MSDQIEQKIDLKTFQDLCKNSLEFLCAEVLWKNNAPEQKMWGKLHDDIERMLCRPSKRKLIIVPRGHLKTAIVTKAYSIQTLLKNPNARILIANQVWDKSREMLYEIKEYMTTKSILPQVFGSFESGRWTADEIVIHQRTKALSAASISTTGVEAETTSSHYDLIILDDLQGFQNCQTKEQRDKVKRFYSSMIDLVEQLGQIIVIGTRWHLDDVYQHILDNEKDYYDIMVRKVIEDGKLIFPSKFNVSKNPVWKTWEYKAEPTMDFIEYLKKSKGSDFYSQYMNDPVDEENQLFKKSYFKYFSRRPEGLYVTMTIDPAISQRQEADETAIVICGMDSSHKITILDYIFGRWTPSQILENIFSKHTQWKPSVTALETVGFQMTLKYMLEEEMRNRRYYFPVEELKHRSTISKEMRIKALEPYYRAGMVEHAEWMRDKDLEYQLISFPKAKHDDLADAMASTLEVIMPGDVATQSKIVPGCWEEEYLSARRTLAPYRDFFTHG